MLVVNIGEAATFRCNSTGLTAWFCKTNKKPFHVGDTLTITNADLEKQGYYICKSINEMGDYIRARAHLIIRGKLRVIMYICLQ